MNSVLVGMFDTQTAASMARKDLIAAGFSADAITQHPEVDAAAPSATATGTLEPRTSDEHEGMVSRFFRHLFDGDEDGSTSKSTYDEAFRRGSYGVTVQASSDAELEKAEQILNAAGAVDIDERATQWRNEGWTGAPAASTDMQTAAAVSTGSSQTLQEVEEELKVGKRAVSRGGVRVFSRMTEVPVSESVRLREERADVQRRVVDRPTTEADFAAFKEGTVEVHEMAEEAVVSKTARVVGEVEIGKVVTERDETVEGTVRKTHVEIEQLPVAGTATTTTTPSTPPTL